MKFKIFDFFRRILNPKIHNGWTKEWSDHWNVEEGSKPFWQLDNVHPYLINFYDDLNLCECKSFFLPLCGKTLDMKWLYDKGHYIVGVEGIEDPVKEFFEEHEFPYLKSTNDWSVIYKTNDERLKIYCCDFFKMDSDALGTFDAIWDRGSLVAIYCSDRERYTEIIKKCMNFNTKYLLSAVEYPENIFFGPPRSIDLNLLQRLFGDKYDMKVLFCTDRSHDEKTKNWGINELYEKFYYISMQKV